MIKILKNEEVVNKDGRNVTVDIGSKVVIIYVAPTSRYPKVTEGVAKAAALLIVSQI